MNSKLKAATRKWEEEVENEAIRLIEKGVPPVAATVQATGNIAAKRTREYVEKKQKEKTRLEDILKEAE